MDSCLILKRGVVSSNGTVLKARRAYVDPMRF